MRLLGVLLLVSSLAAAQQEGFSPAIAGYVNGGAGRLRTIVGSAGAARQVERAGLPERLVVHAGTGRALAFAGSGLQVFRPERESPETLEGLSTEPTLAAWSPSGTAAALYWRETGRVVVIAGLNARAQVVQDFEWIESVEALAVSDGGGSVALSGARGVFKAGEDLPALAWPQQPAALAYVPASSDLVVADEAGRAVWRVGPSKRIVASGLPEGVIAVGAGRDGSIVTTHRGGSIRVQGRSGTVSTAACRCEPALLQPMAEPGLWLMTDRADEPVWMLDASGPEPRAVFVPAPEAAQ